MTQTLVRTIDVAPQTWRNGGGATRELLAWPGAADWRVRVSVADIEADGPFSTFPGVQRWFAVLKGPGVLLDIAGRPHLLTRNDPPLCFDGAAATECRLIDGPTRDLNLMLRDATGLMQIADDGQTWESRAMKCGLFTAVAGRCSAGGIDIAVPAYALLWFDAAPALLVFTASERPAAAIGWWLAATPSQGKP